MSIEEQVEMLNAYIKTNVAAILMGNIPTTTFGKDTVIIPSTIDISLLNGHYEGVDFLPPKWYQQLVDKKNYKYNFLIIEDLAKISKEEQTKFIELLKYRKIGVFELPKNCIIIITSHTLEDVINEEIYSLVAKI